LIFYKAAKIAFKVFDMKEEQVEKAVNRNVQNGYIGMRFKGYRSSSRSNISLMFSLRKKSISSKSLSDILRICFLDKPSGGFSR